MKTEHLYRALSRILVFFWAGLLLAGCGGLSPEGTDPETKSEITVDVSSLDIFTSGITVEADPSGGVYSRQVLFFTTDQWTATLSGTEPLDWITIQPTSGAAGTASMRVSVVRNESESERTAEVTITCGKVKKSFRVKQAPAEPANPPYVFPAVVVPDYDKATITVCDTEKGEYSIQFKDEVAPIKEGSVVIVPQENETLIVLVTKASTNGNRVDFSGPLGDLRYVFKDVEFTIRIGDDPSSGPSKQNVFYYDDQVSGTRASKHVKLWDTPFIEDYSLWKLEPEEYPEWMIQIPDLGNQDASLGAHVEFFPDLSADIDFKFGAPTTDILDKVAFVLAGAYDLTATFNGNIHSSIDINFDYKMDEVLDGIVHGGEGPRYFFDHTELLKHALFTIDPKTPFVVFGVPFWLHIGCDLLTEVQSMMLGEAHLTFGVESDVNLTTSVTVSPYRDDSLSYDKDFKMTWDGHEPVFTGDSDLRLKWYVYPHIYVWVDRAAGPALDIKPYATIDFEYGTNITFGEWDAYESFGTLNTEGFVGLDWAAGVSTPLENYYYEVDSAMKDLGNIVEGQIIKSPSGLVLESEPGEIKAGKPTTFDFKVLGDFWGATATTWFPSIIKLDFPKEGKGKLLFPILGKASYTWTPQFENDEMVARVFDVKGDVLGQLNFRAAAGDMTRILTEEAKNITTTSATITSIVESNVPVQKAGIVYSSTTDIPKVGEAGCISKLSTEAGSPFTIRLDGLKPSTKYNYRAFAVVSGDSGENVYYSTCRSFITTTDGNGGVVVDIPGEDL